MFQSLRKTLAVPHLPVEPVAGVVTAVSFLWLLGQGLVHPVVVYLLQVYLAF